MDEYEEAAKVSGPMEAAWITKNNGDDLYLQSTYTFTRVLNRRLAHESKKDKVRRRRPGRDETTPPIQHRIYNISKLFLSTRNNKGVDDVMVPFNSSLTMNIELITRTGHLRTKRCGSVPSLTIFAVYAPTSTMTKTD
ncbi:unnamed protein product [Angiostrongylus costaricensis]|uniref:Uncharacterized protein n=1 Tax=Angiostrongylus costaricensis TaxID=334426 RepID=A0A0R3PA28_ANGCS|nr:unnamed protein product [Angiostrongylus costaricensis]